ncbi:MAG: hypothetical protein V2I24_09045 [Halieaceae bacterium]|nr:hypothetical protein [Halieaceae bacterium]
MPMQDYFMVTRASFRLFVGFVLVIITPLVARDAQAADYQWCSAEFMNLVKYAEQIDKSRESASSFAALSASTIPDVAYNARQQLAQIQSQIAQMENDFGQRRSRYNSECQAHHSSIESEYEAALAARTPEEVCLADVSLENCRPFFIDRYRADPQNPYEGDAIWYGMRNKAEPERSWRSEMLHAQMLAILANEKGMKYAQIVDSDFKTYKWLKEGGVNGWDETLIEGRGTLFSKRRLKSEHYQQYHEWIVEILGRFDDPLYYDQWKNSRSFISDGRGEED